VGYDIDLMVDSVVGDDFNDMEELIGAMVLLDPFPEPTPPLVSIYILPSSLP